VNASVSEYTLNLRLRADQFSSGAYAWQRFRTAEGGSRVFWPQKETGLNMVSFGSEGPSCRGCKPLRTDVPHGKRHQSIPRQIVRVLFGSPSTNDHLALQAIFERSEWSRYLIRSGSFDRVQPSNQPCRCCKRHNPASRERLRTSGRFVERVASRNCGLT
jgi:hypothetical protein